MTERPDTENAPHSNEDHEDSDDIAFFKDMSFDSDTPSNLKFDEGEDQQTAPDMAASQEINADQPASSDHTDAVAALVEEKEQLRDQAMRALAEAENTRRRAKKDVDDTRKYALSGFAKDIIGGIDNFERAMDSIPEDIQAENDQVKNIVDGVKAVKRELIKSLGNHGVKKIDPLDEIFDPNFHEVMMEHPNDEKPAGTVLQVLEKGYAIHDRLLRPARVIVSKPTGVESKSNIDQKA